MKDPELWRRVEAAAFPPGFTEKLGRDYRWSRAFSEAAVDEYRRFVYLSQIGTDRVTPSVTVDKVWHMHLVHSRNYWDEWSRVLYRPLHHEPAAPKDSGQTHRAQYATTLERYAEEFGAPPERFWPARPRRAVNWIGILAGPAGIAMVFAGVVQVSTGLILAGAFVVIAVATAVIPEIRDRGRAAGCGDDGGGCGADCGGGGCGD